VSGRHRPSRGFARGPLTVLGAASVLVISGFIVKTVTADAGGCSATSGVRLTVAVDPALAPVVSEIAERWQHDEPAVNGNCIGVDVQAKDAADLANSLGTYSGGSVDVAATPAPTPSEADLPTVWIPDSTAWLGRVRTVNRDAFDADTASVALSPVVIGMPEAVARALPADVARAGGITAPIATALLEARTIKFGLIEPRRDTAGLVGAMLLSDAVVTSDADLPKLVGTYRKGVAAPLRSVQSVFDAFAKGGLQAAPMSEQAVIAHNAGSPAVAVAAVPLAVSRTLDYPYALLAGRSRELQLAAGKFRDVLTSDESAATLAKYGFRTPSGAAGPGFIAGHGVTLATAHVQPVADMMKVAGALGVWVAAKTPSHVIAMVDATSSMNRTMSASGHTDVRIEVLRKAATYGLGLFTDDSKMALWAYAGNQHQQLVGMDMLDAAQRAKLKTAVNLAHTVDTNICPLFETLVAAYKEMKDTYDRGRSNTIVVFTDGGSNLPGGLDLDAVRTQLERLADVTKPIRVIILGLGPDVDMVQLNGLAEVTGGAAFKVSDPLQLNAIFLKALLT
jgi:hypothetical protein